MLLMVAGSLFAGISIATLLYLLILRLTPPVGRFYKRVKEEVVTFLPEKRKRYYFYLLSAYFVAGFIFGWMPSLVVFLLPVLQRAYGEYRRKKLIDKIENQLVDFLNFYSSSIRAGKGLVGGFEAAWKSSVDPLKSSLEVVLRDVRAGRKLGEAIISWAKENGTAEGYLVGTAITIFQETGGNFTEILQKISEVLKRRISLKNKVKSLSAMGRLQAIVMTFLAPGVAAVMFLMAPEIVQNSLKNFISIFMFIMALGLEIVAVVVMRKMMRIDY